MCLDAASPQGPVKIVRCHGMGGNQAWVYNDEVRKMKIYLFTLLEIQKFLHLKRDKYIINILNIIGKKK